MKQNTGLFIWLLMILFVFGAIGESLPEWDYAISPDVLLNTQGIITLANRSHLLSSDYVPSDMQKVTIRHVSGSFELRRECNEALSRLFSAAAEEDCILYVKSAYRSYATQNTMYYNRKKKYGYDDGLVSYPGASDHQTGLGVDVLNYEWTLKDGMNERFGQTKEAQWMALHCMEYGFVIRYPQGKKAITGIEYEPWHLRYVGEEAARYMMQNNMTLEEFYEEYTAYITAFEAQNHMTFASYCKALHALPAALYTGLSDLDGDKEVSLFYQ